MSSSISPVHSGPVKGASQPIEGYVIVNDACDVLADVRLYGTYEAADDARRNTRPEAPPCRCPRRFRRTVEVAAFNIPSELCDNCHTIVTTCGANGQQLDQHEPLPEDPPPAPSSTRLVRLFELARDYYASCVPVHLELWLVPPNAEERGDHDIQADPSVGEPLNGTWHVALAEGCLKATGPTPEAAIDAAEAALTKLAIERIQTLTRRLPRPL